MYTVIRSRIERKPPVHLHRTPQMQRYLYDGVDGKLRFGADQLTPEDEAEMAADFKKEIPELSREA